MSQYELTLRVFGRIDSPIVSSGQRLLASSFLNQKSYLLLRLGVLASRTSNRTQLVASTQGLPLLIQMSCFLSFGDQPQIYRQELSVSLLLLDVSFACSTPLFTSSNAIITAKIGVSFNHCLTSELSSVESRNMVSSSW